MDGVEAENRRAINKRSDEKGGDKEEHHSTDQKNIESAAKKIQHLTNAQKEKEMMRTPENMRLREEAAARCTAKIKRRVLRRQTRKARAEHLVRCSLEPGKSRMARITSKRCTPTWKKPKKNRKTESNISGRKKEISNLQRTDATQRSQWT